MSDTNDSLQSLGLLVDTSEVVSWLKLDGLDPDIWLESAVQAASSSVLDWLGYDPRSQSVTVVRDGNGGSMLTVDGFPITAISEVSFIYAGNAVPQNLSLFTFDQKDPIIYASCIRFPRGRANVSVTYTRGYTVLPGAIKRGVLYTIKAMFDASGVDFNATGENYLGVLSQMFWPSGPGVVPPSAQTLMQRYRSEI